jgi:hypothetical protein
MSDYSHIPALKQQWVLNTTWTNCPEEVKKDVQALWRYHDLGNDYYMLSISVNDLQGLEGCEVEEWDEEAVKWKKVPLDTRNLITYILANNIPEDEEIILHLWW